MPNIELTTKQVADLLGVSRQLVLWLVDKGALTPTRKLPASNGTYLFAADDVERLKEERSA